MCLEVLYCVYVNYGVFLGDSKASYVYKIEVKTH